MIDQEKKKELFKQHGHQKSEKDTGSPEAQIALFTERINDITNHLKENHKDHSSKRGLLKMVGKRRRLLNYLYKNNIERYRSIISELKIRK